MAIQTIAGDEGQEFHEFTYNKSGGTSATGFILHFDDAKLTDSQKVIHVLQRMIQLIHEQNIP